MKKYFRNNMIIHALLKSPKAILFLKTSGHLLVQKSLDYGHRTPNSQTNKNQNKSNFFQKNKKNKNQVIKIDKANFITTKRKV